MTRTAILLTVAALLAACGKDEAPAPTAPVTPPAASQPDAKPPQVVDGAGPATLQPIAIPADGKYENVKVGGVTVPMINVMDGGTVVLVDTDGVKPRSWEEQYKRKAANLPKGYFDLHKTNTNKNDKFDDDAIDKQGRWKMDEKGNIVQD
jgi:hypothetical protein